MDITVYLLLLAEAVLALALLHLSGVLKKPWHVLLSAGLLALAFVLRGVCLDYETLDYQNFLAVWVDYFRQNGGLAALKDNVGNYNVPYLTFLALFSQSAVKELYLIKLLSIFFDVVLAWGVMRIAGHFVKSAERQLLAFFLVLFWPTVILNGALWGQCDSIYVALALLGLWLGLTDRPVLSVLCFALSFGFKLQAVFILPIMAVLWFRGSYKLWHFALFPAFYVLLVLPAVALGKPFLETLTLYTSQTGSIGTGLNYNSPSVYALFWRSPETTDAANLGIAAAFTYMLMLLIFCFLRRDRLSDRAVLTAALLFVVGIPFLLPHMHERYFFGADVLSLVLGFACVPGIPAALLTQFASLLGYHAYLKMRYLLYMDHGSRALIGVILLGIVQLLYDTAGETEKIPEPENSALTNDENLL